MRTLSVRLDDQTDAVLRANCARTGMNQTDAIKPGILALAKEAANELSPAKLAESLGLIGCFESRAGDLGRNHAQRLKEELATQHRGGRRHG